MLFEVGSRKSEDRSKYAMMVNSYIETQISEYWEQLNVKPVLDYKVVRKTSDFRLLTSDNLILTTKLRLDPRLWYSSDHAELIILKDRVNNRRF